MEIVEHASTEELFNNPRHPYTVALLNSVPKMGRGSDQRLEAVIGSVPSLYEMPEGCSFHPRCSSFMTGVCDKKSPEMFQIVPGHKVSCFLYQ